MKRDKWARFRLIVPPVIQMLIFGYAATFEVYHVSTVMLDMDHSQESRELVSRFTSSERFRSSRLRRTPARSEQRSTAAMPRWLSSSMPALPNSCARAKRPLQVIVDGTNSNTALIALGYVDTIAATFSQDYAADLAQRTPACKSMRQVQVTLEQRPWFNEDLNGRWFSCPG